ncbi:MAG: hypothetical protein C4325_02670 [Blastocatellia bacterium]
MLGKDVVNALFTAEDPIGKDIKIGGKNFRVVGVMGDLGSIFGQSRDNSVFIPLTTFQKYWRDIPFPQMVFVIVARPVDRSKVPNVIEQMRDILRRNRNVAPGSPDNFFISSQDALLDIYNQLTGATYLVLTAISAVALMIGGIGVMNIMLVSVTERTREIGIRKAIGARKTDILVQFLIEAATLTGFGGLVGLGIGYLLTFAVAAFFPSYVPWWAPPMGFSASVLIGIIFGLFPAWKAARLDPIESLRYE